MMRDAATVFVKELRDALRDRRTLLAVLLSAVLLGPVLLVALSALVAGLEEGAGRRELLAIGIDAAPTLRNHFERLPWTIQPPPADYEQQLADGRLGDAVLVVPPAFEAQLARGEVPSVELFASSANPRAQASAQRLAQALAAFSQEQALLRLVARGVAPSLLQAIDVQQRDLASARSRGAQLTAVLPLFVLMAVLYGALGAALDTTAGERERGSLEPLLMTPAAPAALVLGKWGAAAVVGMLIALLSSLSFLPAQPLLRSETLASLLHFGPREALLFVALLAPLAAALAAVLMAIAIGCRSFKEAQAASSLLILVVSLLPLVAVLGQQGESRWHLWLPALAQVTLMNRVLKGEPIGAGEIGVACLVAALLAVLALAYVTRVLRRAAVQ